MRGIVVAIMVGALGAGCTDFEFQDNLACSASDDCPPGFFCDSSIRICHEDLAGCGDGMLAGRELCDDGNRVSGDGCRADCLKIEACGDGIVDPSEACDDGAANGATANCLPTCELARCGDGFVHTGSEECDDGSSNAEDAACLPTCEVASCGDGFIRSPDEECDDGAANSDTAACTSQCRTARCGDGLIRAGVEECDDANAISTDACLTTCALPTCGDGFVHFGVELCDGGDACLDATCTTNKVVQIVAGQNQTCALRASGKVRCWGNGTAGKLGYASTANVGDDEIPAKIGDIDLGAPATQLAAGGSHTCALLEGGAVKCWGENAFGQLGYGNVLRIGDDEHPSSVGTVNVGGTVTQIAAGADHTCALLATGKVRCWGRGENGRLGYAGVANVGDAGAPAAAGDVDVGGTVTQIAAGGQHTCALLATGAVRCWGNGLDGRLGHSAMSDIGDDETPASAGDIALPGPARQIAAGGAHTCAVLATGKLRCWGRAADGQLGLGNVDPIGDTETPAESVDTTITDGAVVAVATGNDHTCALSVNGAVTCWGLGLEGRLGYGNTSSIGDTELPGPPVPVAGAIAQVTAGGLHTCVLMTTGAVRCWGRGNAGRLGYGNSVSIGDVLSAATAGDVIVGVGALDIGTGALHTCALLDSGRVRCWGSGANGRLGNLGTANVGTNGILALVPDAVISTNEERVIQLAVGSHHSCALLETGAVRCWGLGTNGRLGYASTSDVGDDDVPGDVPLPAPAISIEAGGNHTCARLMDNTVRCWGFAAFGQLGYASIADIGDNESALAAAAVAVGGNVTQLVTGGSERSGFFGSGLVQRGHTCALLDTGVVRCWGLGNQGQLGYANTDEIRDTETPTTAGNVNVGGTVAQLAAGAEHTCALLTNGAIRCWGFGGDSESGVGRLGYGNTGTIGDDEAPASAGNVNVGGTALAVAAGGAHTCALLSGGRMRCWGSGIFGQLGYGDGTRILTTPGGDVPIGAAVAKMSLGGDIVLPSAGGPGGCNPPPSPTCDTPSSTHTCVVLFNGSVRCWGSANVGQLGYGDTNQIGDNEAPSTVGNIPL